MQLLGLGQTGNLPAHQEPQAPSELAEQQQEAGRGQVEPSEAAAGEQAVKTEMDGERQQQQRQQQQLQQQPPAHAVGQVPAQPAASAPAPGRNVLSVFGIAGAQADAMPAASTQTGPSQTGTGSEADGGSMQDGDDDAGSSGQQQQQQSAPMPPHGAVQLAPRVQDGKKAALQAHWEELRQRAQVRMQS